jgi:hypothetical protein
MVFLANSIPVPGPYHDDDIVNFICWCGNQTHRFPTKRCKESHKNTKGQVNSQVAGQRRGGMEILPRWTPGSPSVMASTVPVRSRAYLTR